MATVEQQKKFIEQAIPCAQNGYKILGKVKPSVAVGMACVECGYGTAGSVKYHSYLGHKVGSGKTATKYWGGKFFTSKTKEEYTIGVHTTITSAFRAFDSMEQCFLNFYELLNTSLYAKVKAEADYKTQMQQIKACDYMTSSTEVNSVISIIEKWNLTQYDTDMTRPAQVKSGLTRVSAYALNIRKEPSAHSTDIGTLYKGSEIFIDELKGNWGHFEGWVNTNYLS